MSNDLAGWTASHSYDWAFEAESKGSTVEFVGRGDHFGVDVLKGQFDRPRNEAEASNSRQI